MGEIELWAENPAARAHLGSVEADARAQGSLLVAKQARALREAK
jgi:hypothetical protein